MMLVTRVFLYTIFISFLFSCDDRTPKKTKPITDVFLGATIIDGTGNEPIIDGVIVVQSGKILDIGKSDNVEFPESVIKHDLSGKIIMPGIINSHGHVGDVKGITPGQYSKENIIDNLKTYAHYGVTTVVSLGGDRTEAVAIRSVNDTTTYPTYSRLYIAGAVVKSNDPELAKKEVDDNVAMGVDFIKIRVDDNLGKSTKMSEEAYLAIISQAHKNNLQLAAHMFYLEDAKSLVEAGADFLAHSIRDRQADSEIIELLKNNNICYCPTLTRDLSTFVYEEVPDFFDDPFFQDYMEDSILAPLMDPLHQDKIKKSESAQLYKMALEVALKNLKILSDSNVTISFGTDSGVATRFPGYFEHLEMQMMADAGMQPMKIITAATKDAANCLQLKNVGSLSSGNWADFIVLDKNPLDDISNTKSISSVWISGKKIER